MIYVTGDTHGDIDISKLNSKCFENSTNLTKSDYVIICGDFGFIWDNNINSKWEKHWLNWLEAKPWTTIFVDGNHENHARLDAMPIETWHNGKIHRIRKNIMHLMRGQVFEIDNKLFFTFGGAKSHDKGCRQENISWWARELPSEIEYAEAKANLEKYDFKIDYVITHCAPTEIQACLSSNFRYDKLTEFLSEIYNKLDFEQWYCGHYHVDEISIMDKRFRFIYNSITHLPE